MAALLLATAACTSYPKLQVRPVQLDAERVAAARRSADASLLDRPATGIKLLSDARQAAAEQRPPVREATAEEIAALLPERQVKVTLPPQPLSQFIDTVFGQVLQVPYFTGPGIAQRRDMVTLREPVAVSNRKFFAMVQMALRQYGVAVGIENNVVRLEHSELLSSQAPSFMRARTTPETPRASRPVIQFAALRSVDAQSALAVLQAAFPRRTALQFAAQEDSNTIAITGDARTVDAATAAMIAVDNPRFAGGRVARVQPAYSSTEQLTEAVSRALAAEGIRASLDPAAPGDVTFLAVPFANSILLFSGRGDAFERALFWVRELDAPAITEDQEGVFIYHVENTTAAELGALIAQLTPGGPGTANVTQRARNERRSVSLNASPAQPPADVRSTGPVTIGQITIDPAGNRLLFRGTRREFEEVRALMIELDTLPPQVLVEITIAEVTLTDETRFGVEWFLDMALGGGSLTATTRGAAAREPGGLGAAFTRTFSRGTVEAALSAIASNRNLNILSTPRLVARSGSNAQILIGTDVPIITSQRAAGTQTNNDTDILQTVQYRQTGVILNMRPVVYGDDRVDIELFQEVSSQEPNRISDIDSPLILNRSVSTQLSLREGMTAVIGGLIQDNYSRDQRGVPILKDIPLLGAAFRSDAVSGTKVELLLLVTPYIIRSDEQMGQAADSYSRSMNRQLRSRGPQVYTLLPWRSPFAKPRAHGAPPFIIGRGAAPRTAPSEAPPLSGPRP